jgi:prolyl oligopeptidase
MRGKFSHHVSVSFALFLSVVSSFGAYAKDEPPRNPADCEKPLTRKDPVVHEDPYRWLERDSEERRAWVSEQQKQTMRVLRASPTREPLRNLLWKLNEEAQDIMVKALDNGFELALVDRGLRQPNEIVLRQKGKEIKVLFSTRQIAQDGSVNLTKFYLDPKKQRLLIPVTRNGSLDIADIHVVNIESGKVEEVIREVGDYGITWISSREFNYQKYIDRDGSTFTHQLGDTRGDRLTGPESAGASNDPSIRYVIKTENQVSKLRAIDGTLISKLDFEIQSIVAENDSFLYVTREREGGWTEVVQITKSLSPTGQVAFGMQEAIEPTENGRFTQAFATKDHTLLTFRLGQKFWGVFLDARGRLRREIPLPSCCDIRGFRQISATQAEITLASAIHQRKTFTFNLESLTFDDADLEQKMLTDDEGVLYKNEYITAQSKDGKEFPIRMTYRNDLKLDGNNAALVEGYGGFNVPGYFDPYFNPMNAQFIRRGGIHVAPVLRGGSELGPEFREDAKFEGKQKTFDDMIATLEVIAARGYTKASKIAAMGWSNGGLLLGAIATQRPDLLKLAIPGNGVQDMLRKEVLDPRFANGWEYEYGSPNNPKHFDFLKKYSPVHNAKPRSDYPTILIVAGLDDSRVNVAHSFKLAAALQEAQSGKASIFLLSVPQAGHWDSKMALQDLRAIETLLGIWTLIYDELGLPFTLSSNPAVIP